MIHSRKALKYIICLILLTLVVSACSTKPKDPAEDWQRELIQEVETRSAFYTINAELIPDQNKLRAQQRVTYINNEDVELNTIFFHLYPNAFKYNNTLPFSSEDYERVYPKGFEPGYIEIKEVSGMEGLKYNVDATLLKVTFPQALAPNEKAELQLEYEIKIPPCLGRFGYGDRTFNLGNWYPVLAVYDETGWNLDPYYAVGDPFYSECAFYKVKIKAPKDFVIASTGNNVSVSEQGKHKVWEIEAGPVRDFAFVASKHFKLEETQVNGIRVKSFSLDEAGGEKALDYAAYALEFFNEYFGKYPYHQYSVAASDFFLGGMEYPNMVMIGERFYQDGFLEYVVVHETAHQWWYGMVGNDQVEEAWLDEALTEFSTYLYYEQRYGKQKAQEIYNNFIKNRYRLFELANSGDNGILKPLYQFEGWNDYDALVYARGAMMISELRKKIGEDKFQAGMRKLFKEYLFDTITTEEFVALWQEMGSDELDGFFEKWF